WTGCGETTRWSLTAAVSSARIFGRSPSETSSARLAWPNGPLKEYGWCDQTSKWTVLRHVRCGCVPFDRQSSDRMYASGETAFQVFALLPNGSRPPATTRFALLTAWTEVATAFTIPR